MHIKITLVSFFILMASSLLQAMEAVAIPATTKQATITGGRHESLKARAVEIIMQQLLTGTIDAKEAEKNWSPDIIELLKERLLYHNLLFFVHLFKQLAQNKRAHISKLGCSIMAASDGGRYIVQMPSCDNITIVRLCDTWVNEQTVHLLVGHKRAITRAAFSQDGRFLITGSLDNTARVWDLTQFPISSVMLAGHTDPIRSVALNADGSLALTGSERDTARLWDLSKHPIIPSILKGHLYAVTSVTFSNNGKYAVTGTRYRAMLWDIQITPEVCGDLEPENEEVTAIAFNSDDSFILTCSSSDSVRLWDRAKIEDAYRITKGTFNLNEYRQKQEESVKIVLPAPSRSGSTIYDRSVAFCDKGRYALASGPGDVFLLDLRSNTHTAITPPGEVIVSARFSAHSKSIIVNQQNGALFQYPFYSLADLLSLEHIVMLIKARTNTALAAQIKSICMQLLDISSAQHSQTTPPYQKSIILESLNLLSCDILTILSVHNFEEQFEFNAQKHTKPAPQAYGPPLSFVPYYEISE